MSRCQHRQETPSGCLQRADLTAGAGEQAALCAVADLRNSAQGSALRCTPGRACQRQAQVRTDNHRERSSWWGRSDTALWTPRCDTRVV